MAELKTSIEESFKFIIKAITKPGEAFKNDLKDFTDTKKSLILAGVVTIFIVLVAVITAMAFAIAPSKTNSTKSPFSSLLGDASKQLTGGRYTVRSQTQQNGLRFDRLGDVKYLEIIFKTLIAYALIISAAAGTYYLAGLVVKKEVSFTQGVAVVSVALVPYAFLALILSPLLFCFGLASIGALLGEFGVICAVILGYEGINSQVFSNESADDRTTKIFVNIVCLAILAVACYYIEKELLRGVSAANALSNVKSVLDMLK